jgi:hypothetical protein
LPDEQSSEQLPVGGHVSSHDPDEQSIEHGDDAHVEAQWPLEHGHDPLVHACIDRPASVTGSGTTGSPLGPPPSDPPELPPPPPPEPQAKQANRRNEPRTTPA